MYGRTVMDDSISHPYYLRSNASQGTQYNGKQQNIQYFEGGSEGQQQHQPDASTDGCLHLKEGTSGNVRKILFIIIISLIVLLAIIAIPILAIYFVNPKKICDEDKRLNLAEFDCLGDGFLDIRYVLNNTCGMNQNRYVKYKFVDDVKNYKFYNFSRAKQECEKLGATMWEILDGEPEWEAFISLATELDRSNLWINAEVVGECDPNIINADDEDPTTCKRQEAIEGHGLAVRWSSSLYAPKFSRLIRGVKKNTDPKDQCVFVDNSNNDLWDVRDCASSNYWGLCVKRKCLWPEHQGSTK